MATLSLSWDFGISGWSGDAVTMGHSQSGTTHTIASTVSDYTYEDKGTWYLDSNLIDTSSYKTISINGSVKPKGPDPNYVILYDSNWNELDSYTCNNGTTTNGPFTFNVTNYDSCYISFQGYYNHYYSYASQYGRGGSTIVISSVTAEENKYTVTLKAGTGISAVTPATTNSVQAGKSITIGATVQSGYRWKNWTSGNSVVSTSQSYTFTPSSNVTYTANAATAYTISFDSQGGSAVSSIQRYSGESYGTLSTPTRTGYAFKGWYTTASGNTQITASSTFSGTSNITLYAQWTANSYTLTYDANGGTISSGSKTKTIKYDEEFGTFPTVVRTGYTFLGWYTAASGGTKIETSTKFTFTKNTTIYAQWSNVKYTITLNAQGGKVSPESFAISYGEKYTNLPIPTRAGCTFLGWYTAENGGGTYITTSSTHGVTQDRTFYALWEINGGVVTLFLNNAPKTALVWLNYQGIWHLAMPYLSDKGVWHNTTS